MESSNIAVGTLSMPISDASTAMPDEIIAAVLLGLSASEAEREERQPLELAKGEIVEGQAISSGLEKGEDKSGPLERTSEGEVRVCVSQGEPLMQE